MRCYICGSFDDLIELTYENEDGSKRKDPVPLCRKCFFGEQVTDVIHTERKKRMKKQIKKMRRMQLFRGDEKLYDEF